MRENTKFWGSVSRSCKRLFAGKRIFHIRNCGFSYQEIMGFFLSRIRDFAAIRNHVKQKSGALVYFQVALHTNYCFLRHPRDLFFPCKHDGKKGFVLGTVQVGTGLLVAEVNVNTMCELGSGGVSLVSMAYRTLGIWGVRVACTPVHSLCSTGGICGTLI
jgi:hypothetical protein